MTQKNARNMLLWMVALAMYLEFGVPAQVYAIKDVFDGVDLVLTIFDAAVALIISFAFIAFLWGIVKFIAGSGSETARDEGKRLMLWGIAGLFVMVSIWGLVTILVETFDISEESIPFRVIFI